MYNNTMEESNNWLTSTIVLILAFAIFLAGQGTFANQDKVEAPHKNRKYWLMPSTVMAGVVLLYTWYLFYTHRGQGALLGADDWRFVGIMPLSALATVVITLAGFMYASVWVPPAEEG